jgi:hypothetical protein
MTAQENPSAAKGTSFNIPFLIFAVIFNLAWVMGWLLAPALVIRPQLEAKTLAKAKTFPDADVARFNFFPVSYDQETHMIPPFNTNLGNCLGLSCLHIV